MTKFELFAKAREMSERMWEHKGERPTYSEREALTGFICEECGCSCSYAELESWLCKFSETEPFIICSECYETEMGDDL